MGPTYVPIRILSRTGFSQVRGPLLNRQCRVYIKLSLIPLLFFSRVPNSVIRRIARLLDSLIFIPINYYSEKFYLNIELRVITPELYIYIVEQMYFEAELKQLAMKWAEIICARVYNLVYV